MPVAKPKQTIDPTSNPFTEPEAIAGNQTMRDKVRAMDTTAISNLVKSFTFERDGRRDTRDPSNMEPELIAAAQDWDARGRPQLPQRIHG